ncbi:hypothetical protein AVEN_97213-1 [Araneus ventricosus]|uniref:Ubiquitin-like protease family profile domain-containing protein n=1 Tax=Araneus ventricosus TaxID=182803 RepID=A0A4Y2GCH5_ARAVE|nr:hypothetical protein AVEN_97213-1 [Araneus ventricosus]
MISKFDIQEFFSLVNTNSLFRGVFASDQIPDLGPGPGLIIVNTATSSTSGEHWIVIGVDNDLLYFFDSFGLPPTKFNSYISSFASRYHCYYNDVRFQDFKTEVCGYYTIFVIVRIVEGRSHWDIRRELEECGNSDNYVEQQVKGIYQKAVERLKVPSCIDSDRFVSLFLLFFYIIFYFVFSTVQMIKWVQFNPCTYSDLNYGIYDDNMMDID